MCLAYTCIYIYIYYMYKYVCTRVCIYICMKIGTFVCVCVCVCVCMSMSVRVTSQAQGGHKAAPGSQGAEKHHRHPDGLTLCGWERKTGATKGRSFRDIRQSVASAGFGAWLRHLGRDFFKQRAPAIFSNKDPSVRELLASDRCLHPVGNKPANTHIFELRLRT